MAEPGETETMTPAPPKETDDAKPDDHDGTGQILTTLNVSELVSHIDSSSPPNYRVITVAAEPVVHRASPPGTDGPVLLALMTDDRQLALYREPLTPAGRSVAGPSVEPLALNVQVETVRTIAVDTSPERINGFHVILESTDRAEELFVIATEAGSYSVRMPFSSVSRTILRDLNDDGMAELVQYSRVFEAGGRREIIVDAFEWNGQEFVHSRSLPLLRRVNQQLHRLKTDLENAERGSLHFDDALKPEPGEPDASEVLPAESVRVPEFSELPVELGRTDWELEHDIAIYHDSDIPAIFRITIAIRANPFLLDPVGIVGLNKNHTRN
jgi:hypothetical protein